MPDTDWTDVFGPAPQRQSSASNVKNLDATSEEFRSISDRALKLRNRMTRSHTVSFEGAAFVSPLLKEVEEGRIVSQNVEAMLNVVQKLLQEKREKRMAEESIVRWPWPDTKMASTQARPGIKSGDCSRQGTGISRQAGQKTAEDRRSSTSRMQHQSGDPKCSERKRIPDGPSKHSHLRSEKNAELARIPQSPPVSYIRSHSSSLYSRSTNDTASQHQARTVIDPSTSSAGTDSTSDNAMIAWPWPSTIVQAATKRSSTASSLELKKLVFLPLQSGAHGPQ